ncbi:MAG: hypothetical protein R3C56_35980 [Pirellulaceae bacterium]
MIVPVAVPDAVVLTVMIALAPLARGANVYGNCITGVGDGAYGGVARDVS